jgi:ribosomal protein L7Ae-like RNA K-turn-binding protein
MIEDGLRGRIRDLVGFARRAGQAVSGWHAAREWLQTGRVGLLVQAADGSPAEKARLLGHRDVPVAEPLTAADLGAPFGRDRAVHVAVARGRLAERIAVEAARLAGLVPAATIEGAVPPGGQPGRGGRKPGNDPARPGRPGNDGRDGAADGRGRVSGTE